MVELVPIREADRDALRAAVRRDWLGLMPHAPVVRDPVRGEAEFVCRFRLDDAGSAHWWAVLDGISIGFANVDLAEDNGERKAQARDFYVEPEWRRQGHGRAFAEAMIAWPHEQGVGQIDLKVRQDHPVALAFWRSLGFDLVLYQLRRYR